MIRLTTFLIRRIPMGIRTAVVLAAAVSTIAIASRPIAPAELDTLDRPARQSAKALNGPFSGIAASGPNAIAVGVRGTILVLQDAGTTWKQVSVPVSADLTTVRYVKGDVVWALGHDAVALRSNDGGQTWNRVLDGCSLFDLMTRHYRALVASGNADAERLLVEVQRAAAQSATPGVLSYPFLDIWIGNDGEGFLVGAFGLLLHTADGGETWEPWLERANNDRRMHLYALEQAADGTVYLAGEQGLVRRYDRKAGRFVAVDTPYTGTYFGLKAAGTNLIAYGLRGNAFISSDEGKNWKAVPLGSESTIVAVLAPQPDRLDFVTQGGQVFESKDGGASVTDLGVPRGGDVLAAALIDTDRLALARTNGVTAVQLRSR